MSVVLLKMPVSDPGNLSAFLDQCLAAKVTLIAVYGPGADQMEQDIDEALAFRAVNERGDTFIATTAHGSLHEAEEFAAIFDEGYEELSF